MVILVLQGEVTHSARGTGQSAYDWESSGYERTELYVPARAWRGPHQMPLWLMNRTNIWRQFRTAPDFKVLILGVLLTRWEG